MSKLSSFSRSPIVISKMLQHYKAMLDELQCSLDLLCLKVKVLKDNVGERKANLQLEEEE